MKIVGEEQPEDTTPAHGAGKVRDPDEGYDDGRKPWDWKSRYPDECKPLIMREAIVTLSYFAVFLLASGISACLGNQVITGSAWGTTFALSTNVVLTFFVGALGGTTFSMKWLMHSVATGKWHIDRLYWRIFVPLVGGVYAVVVMQLFNGGLVGGGRINSEMAIGAAVAFLVGYFSDGVSGLLTNVANAVFGTVHKK